VLAPVLRVLVRRVLLAGLAGQLLLIDKPAYRHAALASALAAAAANPRQRRVAATALAALGVPPAPRRVWRFSVDWWRERMADEILSYQIDRLSRDWVSQHVALLGPPPPSGGAILLSVHQWNQRLAFARLADTTDDLGLVSMWQPTAPDSPRLAGSTPSAAPDGRQLALSRASREIFGANVFSPDVAGRRGLELLRSGGALIILADFFGPSLAPILGRLIPVADGVAWLAEQSGRPIVPFQMSPIDNGRGWRVTCGEPIEPTQRAVHTAVEDAIRAAPAAWMSWRGWHYGALADQPR